MKTDFFMSDPHRRLVDVVVKQKSLPKEFEFFLNIFLLLDDKLLQIMKKIINVISH